MATSRKAQSRRFLIVAAKSRSPAVRTLLRGDSQKPNGQPPVTKLVRPNLGRFAPAIRTKENKTDGIIGMRRGLAEPTFATSAEPLGVIFCQPEEDSPGFLLLDTFLRPMYANEEAVAILLHPENPQDKKRLSYFLAQRISSLLPRRNGSTHRNFASEFLSGKRHYQIRAFALKSRLGNTVGPTMAVLLERNRRKPANRSLAEKFHLTQRENEALELLMRGQTTKQVASCMHISPNTAKAFLRSVMFKMGVTERSGILVKILQVSEGVLE